MNELPCHHNLEQSLEEWFSRTGLAAERNAPLFPTMRHGKLTGRQPMAQAEVYQMIRRRAGAAGIATLRAMMQALDLELIRAKRQNQPLAVIVAQFSGLSSLKPETSNSDVDCWLRETARLLKTVCREYDHVARIGDDTFTLILAGMKRENLGDKIEKVHTAVMNTFPQLIENGTIRFGVGWAGYPDDADTSKALLAIAEGRNEMRMGSSTENLLAMHAHNCKETESPATAETQFEPSSATRS